MLGKVKPESTSHSHCYSLINFNYQFIVQTKWQVASQN